MIRMSIPGSACVHCGAIMGQSLVCPGCEWIDPLTKTPDDAPSVPSSSAVQGSVRTEGPTGTDGAQAGFLVQHSGVGPATVWPVTIGPAQPRTVSEPEPPIEDRLRALAAAEMAASEHGTRVERAAAEAAARAYRLAADMIEEEQA